MATCCVYKDPFSNNMYRECTSSSFCPSPQRGFQLDYSFSVNNCADCLRGFMSDDEIESIINQNIADQNVPLRTKEYIMVEDLHRLGYNPGSENASNNNKLGICFIFWINGSVTIVPVGSESECRSWMHDPNVIKVEFRTISFTPDESMLIKQPNLHNQTYSQYIIDVENRKKMLLAPELGVAIFVIPDPEKGIDALKGVAIDDIGYDEAVRRAQHCRMFKWVPHSVGTFEDYKNAKTSFNCTAHRCYSGDDCQPSSWCFCGGIGPIYTCEYY